MADKKRKILVFGAGENQVPLIEACRDLGYFTLVADPKADAPGATLADAFFALPARDLEGHRELIRREKIDGIVTCQMENPLELMATLANEFGLPFPSPHVIRQARNKVLMKAAFVRHGLPCARGMVVQQAADLQRIQAEGLAFPLIIKPVDSFSSRGVFRAEHADQLANFLPEAKSFSSSGEVLVEEFLEGPEVSVESITFQGSTTVVRITDKVITPFPRTVELAHLQPSTLPPETQAEVIALVKQAVQALGIDNSGSHTEVKITPQGPKLVEIGARLGGDFITSWLTSLSCGVNMNRAVAQVAMGETPGLTPTHYRAAVVQYVNWEPGRTVQELHDLKPFLADPRVARAGFFVKPGEQLPEVTDSAKRHAYFIASAPDRESLQGTVTELNTKLSSYISLV